jgi:ribosomal protein S18 acetylase RimI-like enzyme
MYKCEYLTLKKLQYFKILNDNRKVFNSMNQDFFSYYNNKNPLQKYALRRQVCLLRFDCNYIGYLWITRYNRENYFINSFNILDEKHRLNGGYELIRVLKPNKIVTYECEKNNFNFTLLEKLGFKSEEGTIELFKDIDRYEDNDVTENVSFEILEIGKQEGIRRDLQNKIFMNNSRDPLTLKDIYYDEEQDYYWKEGSIFIKYNGEYIGYGQIIKDDLIPTIVNFGIIDKYRHRGFGRILLKQLLNLLFKKGYTKAKIKVHTGNITALNLYISTGFKPVREYYRWNLVL